MSAMVTMVLVATGWPLGLHRFGSDLRLMNDPAPPGAGFEGLRRPY